MQNSEDSVFDRLEKLETLHQEIISDNIGEGNIIKFGQYNGKDLSWRILHVWKNEKKALFITEKAVCRKAYNAELEPITWENCTLRKWLNTEFIEALNLSESEKARILPVLNRNDDDPSRGTPGGNNTWDRMFLLSKKEAVRCFAGDDDRICIEADSQKAVCWWLRSTGYSGYYPFYANPRGFLNYIGATVDDVNVCVRPAFYLNLES